MIIDNNLLLDTASAITATTASANVVDLAVARDMGVGDDPALKWFVLVTTTFLTTDSATLTVTEQGSTDNSHWDSYFQSQAIAAANLTAGARLFDMDVTRPGAGASMPRYLRLNYTIGTGHFTVGSVTSAIVIDRPDKNDTQYPAGVTVAN